MNLYASTPDAFKDVHETLATGLGASAGSVITNADLGFVSRDRARHAPCVLPRSCPRWKSAVGILAARYRESVERCPRQTAAGSTASAGVDPVVVARVLIFSLADQ